MIPKVNKYNFYLYRDFRDGDNPQAFVQLIAQAEDFIDLDGISSEIKEKISSNKKLCEIFYEDAWSTREGLVVFIMNEFKDLESAKLYYENLLTWANKYFLSKTSSKLRRLIPFIMESYAKIKEIKWDNFEEIQNLEDKFQEYSYSSDALKTISIKILNSPNDFCRDENGDEIDLDFSGTLKSMYTSDVLDKEYTVFKGKILGECKNYINGQLHSIVIQDGSVNVDPIKRWYSNGQIEFEKSYNCVRYWHKNGKIKLEKIRGTTTIWDDQGNITKKFTKS